MSEIFDPKKTAFNKKQITSDSIQFLDTDIFIHSLTEGIRSIDKDPQYNNPRGYHVFINDKKILFLCFYSTIPELSEDLIA